MIQSKMLAPNQVNLNEYEKRTFRGYQENILAQLGYTGLDKEASKLVSIEIKKIVSLRANKV